MRRPTDDELARIRRAMDAWGHGVADTIVGSDVLLVRDADRGWGLFLASRAVADEVTRVPWPVEDAGLPLGAVGEDGWRPSLEAVRRLPRRATGRRVVLSDEVRGRFLYGRGVEAEGIASWGPDAAEGLVVAVYGKNGDPLGLGRAVPSAAGRRLDPIVDLGWYLRRGG